MLTSYYIKNRHKFCFVLFKGYTLLVCIFLKNVNFIVFIFFLAGNSINNKHIQYGEMTLEKVLTFIATKLDFLKNKVLFNSKIFLVKNKKK